MFLAISFVVLYYIYSNNEFEEFEDFYLSITWLVFLIISSINSILLSIGLWKNSKIIFGLNVGLFLLPAILALYSIVSQIMDSYIFICISIVPLMNIYFIWKNLSSKIEPEIHRHF